MSKAYAESRARKAQEQRRKEEEQKKRQKQQAQVSKSAGKSAVGGALRGATASKSTGKAYRPAVESPSYDWLSGTTRTPSQFGQKSYDDNKATLYQQYMQNADAISSADALNRYMQQANDYFNSTYTDRNAGMKLRNSGLMSGVQSANAAGQKVQKYFSGNPQIYSNGQYAEEKANYGRISSEVADPALNYRLRARTGDASVFNENMDDSTRSQAGRLFKLSQYENFTNAMRQRLPSNGHVGGSAQKQYRNREIVAIMAGEVPDFKATQAVTGGADTYQGVADMQSAYSRDQVASDVETVTYQDGTAREIQAATERLDALVGSGYSARLQQNWSKDPNVRMEALNAYDANEQMLSNYYDQTVGANSPDEVKTTYEDYKNYLVGYNKQLAKEAKDEKLRQQLEADFGGKVQSANAKKSSGGTVAAAFAGLRGQEATKKQQGVYTMIADGYDAARKAGYIDEWQDAQGHDPVTREYYDSGYDHMTDEEKDNFISLYNDPAQGPEVAFEYLNRLKYFTQQRDAYEMEKWTSDLAQKGFWGATAATGVGIAAGYANNAASLYVMTDRLINGDQDGKYNEYSPELRYSLIHDVALGTVGQVIEDATPNLELAGVNVPKAFYNAATSAAESFLNAVSFDHFGAVAMGVGAAGSSYRSNLEKVGSVQGYTEKDAFIDGAFDGFVETLTEYVSVENLLNPTLSPMKNAVRAPLTEMSEEVLGYLIDNGYDTIKYGSRGEIAQRYDELLVQGYSDAEARATITQEMAQELAETILVAGLSGEMMGGTQAIAAQVENSRVGSEVRKNDNVTGLLDLADTLELPEDVKRMSAEQRSAAEKGEKVSSAKLGRILRESMAKLDESGRQILSESAEKLAKNVLLENGYDGDNVNLNALAKKVVRLVSGQKLTELEMKDVARSDAATNAVQALTERTAELKKIDEKAGKLDSLMKPREAAQTEISDRLKEASAPQEVMEAFDESVAKADEAVAKATEAAESDTLSTEEERAVRLESFASEYGKNADVMQNAINDGQDVDAYAKAFKVAEVRGEDGQSFDVVKKLPVLSDLTENQVRIAYELGRGIRGVRSAQLRQNTNFKGAQVQVGNVDTSAIKGHLTGAQQRSIDAARSVAQALGVNIRFFESAANEIGQYTAENGSFDGDTMTISLDIHAGSNSKFNTDYAVMQTLGHELTHFVKSFADSEVFNAYQDFVIGHLSEKMDVDAEVERVTALSAERGVNLSRDGAIEEIIANASGEALMNITQEQITQLAQANPSLAKRIGNRIQEWVKKVLDRIRAAYKGGSVKYEVARQMQDVLTEMSEKWNNALINAAQNRFGTKNQQQETAQQAETDVENSVENSETVHAEEPDVKTEALTEETQSAQEEAESKPQPIAGRHIDQRTTDSVKGVDMDLFSSEGEQIQVGFAEAAKILLADLNSTISGDRTFVSDGGADQTVLGQKRMTSALLEEIKDQTGWTWERIGKSLRAFVLAGETGDLVKNTVTNRTMELYLNEMLTEGYTTLEGVKLTPWGEYVDFVQGLEGAKEHAVREVKGAIPSEDYAFADMEQAGTGGREGYGDSEPKYSLRVQDQDTLDFLNNQETVTTYKTMQLVNGKLFPPMAAVVAGQYEDASVLGQWEAAVEHPELVKVDKSGKTKFTLNKGKGKGSLDAAYNPYMHSSNLVLNDQFSGAYARPNLVTVECEVPVSELTSGYRAQYAKDTVGWHMWHTGPVAGALRKANGTERKVLLSRWIKPVRILENSEVARMYSELLDGTGIAVPDNVVPPDLLVELKKAGVPIAESGKVKTAADGNVIPLSQRFNSDSDDIRFQLRYQDDANQISDRELLANALDTVAQNDTERDYLKRYRKYIKELEQKQIQLDDLSARLKDLKADKASAKANRDLIMRMENNAKTLENSIQRTDKRLMDFEATKALKDVMAREKAAWKQTAKTRSDARVARLRESNRANTQARVDAARERVRVSYERKLETKLEKAKAAMEKKTDRIVGRLENKLERNEARFEERIAKMKESEKRTEYRKRILEDSAAMREWLTTPTNKAHVPEFLRAPLGDFLKSINYSSDSLLRGKGETKADAALIDAMERMSRALAQTRTQPDSLSTAEGYMGYLDLPSGFESEFNEMLDRVKGAMESGADVTDTPLNRMTSAQLKTLSDAIRTLNTSVRNMNRLIANGRYQTARDASASTIEELTKLGDRKKTGAVRDVLSGWIDWKSATPFYAFQRFGEGGKAIFEGIQDGWDRMAFNVKRVLDFAESAYTPKQVRQWSRDTHSVELSSKKKVQMTTAQLMSLYCLSRREQALKHLQGGGIRIASFKTKGGTVNQAENYTLSTADISKLTGMLTAEQIEVADKLQAFMSSVCADWGNEVSMQRFGYNAFTEENYFPIETDSNNRAAVDESARENDLFRLLNLSATKALVQNANNAVVIHDIFDVFAAHAADMAKYNGLALPILDTLKWYNYVEKTKPVNGQFTTQSVQKSLESAYGRDAQKYVTNFLRDLNGKREGGRNDGLINRMISNYKVAAVGANLRVGFLQITSMPRAAYVISPKYLAVGVAKNVAFRNSPIAERKVGIALWKSLGFYDTNISRNIRDLIKNDAGFFEKTRDLSMTLAEKGDYWTMGVIYGAVEAEMADKHADVKKNTAKYDQMVNDRMREIIYKTQVVDSTMTRSDIMRGKGLASIASAFMSEPTLTMNLLSESVYEARMKARAGDSKSVAQALVGSRKFGKALAATTVVCALSAVFEAVFSAYRDDDEYETFLEKFNDALWGDVSGADGGWEKFQAFWNGSIMDNFKLWNNVVFVKDISEALAGDSGDAAMWAAGFGDLAKGVQQLYKSILGDGGKPLYGSIYTTLKGVSELSGIPMSAATRDTIGLYNTIAGEMGWKRIQTSNDKPSDAAEAILRVEENGNTVLADRYRRIANEHGIDEAKLQNAMKSAIQSRFDDGKIEDQRAAELLEDYAGKDADEANTQVSRWRYAKDTGLKYGDMKEDYLSGLLDEATALRYLTAEIGADKAAARIDRWNFEQLHGEDADYSSHWKLWDAFDGSGSYDGKTAEQYVREWAKTTDKKNIAAAIAGRYKDEYLRIKGTPAGNRMLEKLLNLYVAAGYEREYEREYIDKKWVK